MEITAKLNYLRIAPRKVRLVADLIRGKSVKEAKSVLTFTNKRPAKPLIALLNSAEANAKHNFQLEPENLQISKILVNEGPKLKRWMPRARGQAFEIQKKTSHIIIVLKESESKKIAKETLEREKIPERKEIKIKKAKAADRKEKIEEMKRPKIQKAIKRVFRRKAF